MDWTPQFTFASNMFTSSFPLRKTSTLPEKAMLIAKAVSQTRCSRELPRTSTTKAERRRCLSVARPFCCIKTMQRHAQLLNRQQAQLLVLGGTTDLTLALKYRLKAPFIACLDPLTIDPTKPQGAKDEKRRQTTLKKLCAAFKGSKWRFETRIDSLSN